MKFHIWSRIYRIKYRYFIDLNATPSDILETSHTFKGDGFSDEVLNYNNNLWDFIIILIVLGVMILIMSSNIEIDSHKAYNLIKRILLNLKINGKLWLTKSINQELVNLMLTDIIFSDSDKAISSGSLSDSGESKKQYEIEFVKYKISRINGANCSATDKQEDKIIFYEKSDIYENGK